MNPIVRTTLTVLVALALGYLLFSPNESLKAVKRQSVILSRQVDSLHTQAQKYEALKGKYDSLYLDLQKSQAGLTAIQQKLSGISNAQATQLIKIKEELQDIIEASETRELPDFDTPLIADTLRF